MAAPHQIWIPRAATHSTYRADGRFRLFERPPRKNFNHPHAFVWPRGRPKQSIWPNRTSTRTLPCQIHVEQCARTHFWAKNWEPKLQLDKTPLHLPEDFAWCPWRKEPHMADRHQYRVLNMDATLYPHVNRLQSLIIRGMENNVSGF